MYIPKKMLLKKEKREERQVHILNEIRFDVKGQQRKAVANEIGDLLGKQVKYAGVPTCDYLIGQSRLDKEGVFHPGADLTESQTELIFERCIEQDVEGEVREAVLELEKLIISVPIERFTKP